MGKVDARKWLDGGSIRSIGDHDWTADEGTHQDSINIVNGLYKRGAVKVEVEVHDEADEWSTGLVVALPEDEKAARDVLMYLGELHADDIKEEKDTISVAWIS